MRHDRYRPQAAVRLKAGLGADGMLTAWTMRTAVGSLLRSLGFNKVESGVEPTAVEGLATNPYKVANTRVECVLKNTHIPVSFWRSVGSSHNAYIIESFLDEIALAGGQDPYKLRRALLEGKPDWLAVLDLVAEKGDWGKPLAPGRGRGIAIHECFGSIVGEVAEVTVRLAKSRAEIDLVTLADIGWPCAVDLLTGRRADGGGGVGLAWPHRFALRQDLGEGRRAGAGQFRYLSDGPPGASAQDRRAFRAERRRQVGRRRRARNRADRAGGLQRDLLRDRQAHSQPADHGP